MSSLRFRDSLEDDWEDGWNADLDSHPNITDEEFDCGVPFRKSDLDKLPEDELPNYSLLYCYDDLIEKLEGRFSCDGCFNRRLCTFLTIRCYLDWRRTNKQILGDDECYACTKVFYGHRYPKESLVPTESGSFYMWYDRNLSPILQSDRLYTIKQFISLMHGMEVVVNPSDYIDILAAYSGDLGSQRTRASRRIRPDMIKSSLPADSPDNIIFKSCGTEYYCKQGTYHSCDTICLKFNSITPKEYVALLSMIRHIDKIFDIHIKNPSLLENYELKIRNDVFIIDRSFLRGHVQNKCGYGMDKRIDRYVIKYDSVIVNSSIWGVHEYNYFNPWYKTVCEKLCISQHLVVGAKSYFHYLGVCLYDIAILMYDHGPYRTYHNNVPKYIREAMGLFDS